MDRIYKYNSDARYKPNGLIYLQLITAKDLYIQNITVAKHNSGHSDSFQVHVPNFGGRVAGSEDFECATLPTTPLDFQGKI